MAPDLLAVQEVGDPAALVDLAELAEGGWQCPTADPDERGIRVGFMSRLPLADVEQVRVFPAGLRPVQVDDTDTPISEMGRPALRARVQVDGGPVDLVNCHLKSKLVSFPGGRFATRDEEERARSAPTRSAGGPRRQSPSAPPRPGCSAPRVMPGRG